VAFDLMENNLPMLWVVFLGGVLFGAVAVGTLGALRAAWRRMCTFEVAQMEVPPVQLGVPRALVCNELDAFHVRQLLPGGRIAWFREDTGEPVSAQLDRRLHAALVTVWGDAKRAEFLACHGDDDAGARSGRLRCAATRQHRPCLAVGGPGC
jgi:hypothetical protein